MKRFGQDWDAALQIEQTNGEHNEALVWLTDVQTNAASLVASAETARGDTPDTQASAPSWDLSSVMESPSASDSETEMPTTVDTEQRATMTDTEIERSLTPQPPSTPTAQKTDTPGDIQTNLENVLKSQFSKERFDGAMDTLETHGNEEGLRRLRAHDPEVAKQIEQHRKGKEVSR